MPFTATLIPTNSQIGKSSSHKTFLTPTDLAWQPFPPLSRCTVGNTHKTPKGCLTEPFGVFSLAPGGQSSTTFVHDLLNVHRAHRTRRRLPSARLSGQVSPVAADGAPGHERARRLQPRVSFCQQAHAVGQLGVSLVPLHPLAWLTLSSRKDRSPRFAEHSEGRAAPRKRLYLFPAACRARTANALM